MFLSENKLKYIFLIKKKNKTNWPKLELDDVSSSTMTNQVCKNKRVKDEGLTLQARICLCFF
jgi:hypothetical protein